MFHLAPVFTASKDSPHQIPQHKRTPRTEAVCGEVAGDWRDGSQEPPAADRGGILRVLERGRCESIKTGRSERERSVGVVGEM